jgi:hypothetical protein
VIEEVLYKGDWYDDIYVKTPRGWKFKQRAHTRDKNRKAVFLEGTYPLGDARAPKK